MLPPLALIHGWGGSFAASYGQCGWPGLAAAAGRTLIEIDLPGHGTAPASGDPAAYADLAGGLAQLLPPAPLDAVGFSLGGKLLLELAIRFPARFRRIVIGGVGDNIFAPEPAGEALALALENDVPDHTPGPLTALAAYSRASNSNPLALAAVLRRPANPVVTPDRLQNITADILIVNGTADHIARPDAALLKALPPALHKVLLNIGHLDLPGAPAFQQSALDFLNQPRSNGDGIQHNAALPLC